MLSEIMDEWREDSVKRFLGISEALFPRRAAGIPFDAGQRIAAATRLRGQGKSSRCDGFDWTF
jgi:hypothetical protein